MPNAHVLQRLTGLQTILNGVHQSGASMSSSSKGTEREAFIDSFLAKVLPPVYRFGTGDATDSQGLRSGQLDVVVEYPFAPSLPTVGTGGTRLYLAEAVAAVVEVKSDVGTQWSEVLQTAHQLAPLQRQYGASVTFGAMPPQPAIPLFAVGYTGWKQVQSVQSHLAAAPEVAGVLVIDQGIFVSNPTYGGAVGTGPWALWGLIGMLHMVTNSMASASTNPFIYA